MNEKLYYSAADIAAMLGISMGKLQQRLKHIAISLWMHR